MAQIIRSNAPILSNAAHGQAEALAINYWGSLAQEKMFPIPFWEVKQKLIASSSNQIALRVLNINDPNLVSAKWIVFEEMLADSLRDPVEPGVYYFVLDDTLFNGPVLVPSGTGVTQTGGIGTITNTPENNIIRGRIGKDTSTGTFFAFFQAAECILFTPGGGGGGSIGGIKVPPQ